MIIILLCRVEKPTRAELDNLLGKVKAELAHIERQIRIYSGQIDIFDVYGARLKKRWNNSSVALRGVASSYVQSELECSVQDMGIDTGPEDSCKIMLKNSDNLQSALNEQADAIADIGNYNWADKQRYVGVLNERKNKLKTQKDYILNLLGKVDPLVGSFANFDPNVIDAIIDSEKEDKWLQFEFDSEEMEESTSSTSIKTKSRTEKTKKGFLTSTTTTSIKSSTYEQFELEMSQANLKAKGKLLRVHIKRPWFKPEIFDDRKLNFVSCRAIIIFLPNTHYCTFFRCQIQGVAKECWAHQDLT